MSESCTVELGLDVLSVCIILIFDSISENCLWLSTSLDVMCSQGNIHFRHNRSNSSWSANRARVMFTLSAGKLEANWLLFSILLTYPLAFKSNTNYNLIIFHRRAPRYWKRLVGVMYFSSVLASTSCLLCKLRGLSRWNEHRNWTICGDTNWRFLVPWVGDCRIDVLLLCACTEATVTDPSLWYSWH